MTSGFTSPTADAILKKSGQGSVVLPGSRRQIPSAIASLCAGLLVLATVPQSATAEPNNTVAEQTINFAIAAGSLSDNLLEFSQISGQKVLFDADLVHGLNSKALQGRYTVQQALQYLLEGSGLQAKVTPSGSISLEKAPISAASPINQSDPTTLPKVNVFGNAVYDVKDPYNEDYVIPSATAGTKTDTPIMETPLNVQVVSKQVLKDQQVISLDQALKNVSGVTTNGAGSKGSAQNLGLFPSFTLRGFESGVFFRDGFRLQQGAGNRSMANVEAVEVLKGPAAILYGQVEPGGMVNVITKQPLASPYYALGQQFGSYDLYRTTIDATGPVTKDDTLLYRFNFAYKDNGSFRDFVNSKDVFLAPVLKWNIGPRTQATFEFEYNHQNLNPDEGYVPFINGQLVNVPRNRNYGEPYNVTTETIYGGFHWSHQFNDDWSIKQRFSVNERRSSTPNAVTPYFASLPSVYRSVFGFESASNTYSTSLDLTGHFNTLGLNHTLLIGGDYYRLDFNQSQRTNLLGSDSAIDLYNPIHPGTPLSATDPFYKSQTLTDQYGLYIQDQIKLPYDFQVMGGIRYQYLHQSNPQAYSDLIGLPPTLNIITNDAVTPRVGVLWQAQNWLTLYANYVESFGANSGVSFPGNPLPPTSANQYEGGIKTEFFEGRLRATLAYYDLTKTNVASQDPIFNATHNCGGVRCSVPIGAIRSRGPELDIVGNILPGWDLIATYSNTDARIVKSNYSDYQAVGTRMWNVPENMGSLWTTYEIQDGDAKGFKFGSGITLRDGQRACCDTPAYSIPGYATVGLMASYGFKIGKTKLTTQLNVDNLLDKHYFSGYFTSAGSNSAWVDFGQPRNFMGSINLQY